MAKPPSRVSECWPDDSDWLDGAIWVDVPAVGDRDSGCFFDASLLDDAGQPPESVLDVGQSLQVRFRVETSPRSAWAEVSGAWSFDLNFTAIGSGDSFELSERVSQSALQLVGWSGKDNNCVQVAVNVPPGTLPGSATANLYMVSATMWLQPTSGISKPIAASESLSEYNLFSSQSESAGPEQGTPPLTAVIADEDRRAAGYLADTFDASNLVEGRSDPLNIRDDVDVLASIVASNKITPPLSLGIFGDWGAGKSFLMNQLSLRVRQIMDASRLAVQSGENSYYCSEIVQIEFNAWQYAGGQLWASLINRVFEGLRAHLGSDERYLAVMQEIERQDEQVKKAADEVAKAKKELEATSVPTLRRTVAQVAEANPEVKEDAEQFTRALSLDSQNVDLLEVERRIDELRTVSGLLREGWNAQSKNRHRWLVAIIAAMVVVLAGLSAVLPPVGRTLTAVAAVIAPLIAIAVAILKPASDWLRAGGRILGAGQREKQRYAEATLNFEQATARLRSLRHEGPGGLYGFVEDRYQAEDYRRYLGMIPLIRGDLKQLARYAAKGEGGPGIERIILYIDDLDRCAADQVVKVLEAVNLLFGLPLFVVVVAVDSRWLVRSLEEQYPQIFGSGLAAAPSPQDYLEKIIQIPFWLKPMTPVGFGQLITQLAPMMSHEVGSGTSDHPPSSGDTVGGTQSTAQPRRTQQPRATQKPKVELRPQSLELTEQELDFIRHQAPLVNTPRAAKRLLNTYQLVRVAIDDISTFLADHQYRPLLILLALTTGFTGLSAEMVELYFTAGFDDLKKFITQLDVNTSSTAGREWLRVREDLLQVPCQFVTKEAILRWLPVVGRYSFRPGLATAHDRS